MADLNVPISCAGVLIMPGDILVGDPEGVMAIPQAVAAQVAEAGVEAERRDAFSRGKVEAGYALAEAYPLSESLRAEYEARGTRAEVPGPDGGCPGSPGSAARANGRAVGRDHIVSGRLVGCHEQRRRCAAGRRWRGTVSSGCWTT